MTMTRYRKEAKEVESFRNHDSRVGRVLRVGAGDVAVLDEGVVTGLGF
jgi:hypothetical protein